MIPLIYRHAQSPTLKNKICRLLDFSPEEYITEDFVDITGNQDKAFALKNILKARLWKLSQRKLFDRTAARRLKPLRCTTKAFEPSVGSHVILDQGYPSGHTLNMFDKAVEVREMLDEGYCSQKPGLQDEGDLVFVEDIFVLEDELLDYDLLLGDEDAEIDDDLFWGEEEDYTLTEATPHEDLFLCDQSTISDWLGHEGLEPQDNTKRDTHGMLDEPSEDEVSESHIHRASSFELLDDIVEGEVPDHHMHHAFSHELLDIPSRAEYTHPQANITRGEEMLLTA